MIDILITGGTIDKVYNPITGVLGFENTQIVEMLNAARSMVETRSSVIFLRDSLEMTDEHRSEILQRCLASHADKILITHGTDTMAKTAKFLTDKLSNKTVVLLGAMLPYSINPAESMFNLGVAIAAVQNQEYGVYIAMNGQIFKSTDVQKNKTLGIFENA
jgi:L-asparaginase